MSKIKGIYAATLSILNEDLSLNIEKNHFSCRKFNKSRLSWSSIFGSTGQAQLIPISEKINFLNNFN